MLTRWAFEFGAGDGSRTRNIQLGRLALYQLSYSRGLSYVFAIPARFLRAPARTGEDQIGIGVAVGVGVGVGGGVDGGGVVGEGGGVVGAGVVGDGCAVGDGGGVDGGGVVGEGGGVDGGGVVGEGGGVVGTGVGVGVAVEDQLTGGVRCVKPLSSY